MRSNLKYLQNHQTEVQDIYDLDTDTLLKHFDLKKENLIYLLAALHAKDFQ